MTGAGIAAPAAGAPVAAAALAAAAGSAAGAGAKAALDAAGALPVLVTTIGRTSVAAAAVSCAVSGHLQQLGASEVWQSTHRHRRSPTR